MVVNTVVIAVAFLAVCSLIWFSAKRSTAKKYALRNLSETAKKLKVDNHDIEIALAMPHDFVVGNL